MKTLCIALFIVLGLLTGQALAHEVKLEESGQSATVLRLSYADGQPFAFEAYELYRPGQDTPEQVGRTNVRGEIVFLPGAQVEWRVKAFTGDGHGVDQRLHLKTATAASPTAPSNDSVLPRWSLLLTGLGVIFGLFGLVQLLLRKKQS